MSIHSLNGAWELSFTSPLDHKKISTTVCVPCNVEPELVRLGLLDDYMPADTPFATQKFESVDDWTYVTQFNAACDAADMDRFLVFEGIDTIAEVYLNNEKILNCNNMHLAYRVDVTDKLKAENELKVIIRSSELYARKHLHDMLSSSRDGMTNYDSQSHLRKARHQWGWDNAPRLLTSGIIRPVYIESLPKKRFEDIYLFTEKITEEHVFLGANWTYTTPRQDLCNHCIRLSLLDKDERIFEQEYPALFIQGLCRYVIPRDRVELWWPADYGTPKLYTVRIEMLEEGTVVATHEDAFGIRTVQLDYTEDLEENGNGRFVFLLNGEEIYIRGTNWKPLDPLASLADKKLLAGKALEEIRNLNCNMVRIWGGGIYEDPFFYDFCDRNGILVWQDFMLACEIPAIDDAYCALVAKEAEYVIKRYRNHPSLAVWCGDNENDKVMQHLRQDSTALPSDSRVSREILKKTVLCNDPYRTYLPSSPMVSDRTFAETKRGKLVHHQAERHLYPEIYLEPAAIRACPNLFLGETGPFWTSAIAPNQSILAREAERAKRLWNAPVETPLARNTTIFHQDDYYFKRWRQSGKDACKKLLGRDFEFDEFFDFALALNLLCAEDFKDLIEYCRVSRPMKTGLIWWSLMDMFPMLFNYSVIDCDHNRKLPYYWIQKSQQPFALMGVRREIGGELALYAANDTREAHTVSYTVEEYDEAMNKKLIAMGVCKQEKNSVGLIQRIAEDGTPKLWIIKWSENGKEYQNHVFTHTTSYDVMRRWVEVIGREEHFLDEILELKLLKK